MQLVEKVQYMWSTGEIPWELGLTILVLIPKGNTYTQGIKLPETLWKVVEAIIDNRLRASIQFQVVLHGFCAWRDTGTATVEINLYQELASVDQYLLFLVFIGLRKAYNKVDRGRFNRTLEGYGSGPQMSELLANF